MSRPNILVFFTDQQRFDTLGLNGGPAGLTPHFDRFARQGTFFRYGVTPQPVCGPARSCLQTGQYATTTGVTHNGPGLKPESPKLAELLAAAGYRTSYMGKWHLADHGGDGAVSADQRAGYQDWLGANCVELVTGPYSAVLWDEANHPVTLPGYRVDGQTDAMIRYLHERADEPGNTRKPFLLFHSYLEPHHQNNADSYPAPHGYESLWRDAPRPPDLQALGGSSAQHWAGYLGMIKRLDEALGRTMDALESTGLADNTVVVFISDHGCHFKTRNDEYKRSPHEASVRVPFAIWGPGWNGGGEHTEAASLVDLMPTLLETAGVPIPDKVQGRSLLPLTRGQTADWPTDTLIQFGDHFMPPGRALRTNRWKYAVSAPAESSGQGQSSTYHESHLYDLKADPYELTNLVESARHASLRATLRQRLQARMAAIDEPPAEIHFAPPATPPDQHPVEYPDSRPIRPQTP